jgi:hypothetical protein
MKSLVLSILLFVLPIFGFSQLQIDSNIVKSDFGGDFVAIKLKVLGMMVLNDDLKTENVDSLYSCKSKKQSKPFFYFYFNINDKKVLYRNRDYYTNVGFIKSTNLVSGSICFDYLAKKGKTYQVKITSGENNKFNVLILEKNKRGKVKTYFSKNCDLSKFSV